MGVVALRLLYVGIMVAILLLRRRLSFFFLFLLSVRKKKIKEEKSSRAVVRARRLHAAKIENKSCERSKSLFEKFFLHFHFLVSSEHLTQLAYSSSVC